MAANRAENQLERPMSPRSKEAEVLNRVQVALKNMLSPKINELLHRMADRHDFISALVFDPELNCSFVKVLKQSPLPPEADVPSGPVGQKT